MTDINWAAKPSAAVTAVGVCGGRTAAVVDLENIAIVGGVRVSSTQMAKFLAFVDSRVSGMPVRVATGQNVLRPFMHLLGRVGWGLTVVRTEPDAADHALTDTARDFIRCGVTDIVVVSGDHAFVPLAANARLHVISHASQPSNALRLAATTVTCLPDGQPPVRIAS